MANEDVGSQSLEGPWSSHLYIGFSPANRKTVLDLRVWLEKHGVSCKPRATKDSIQESSTVSIQESIRDGVTTCQKCLLLLTSDYVKDDWYKIETNAVIEKSQRFSRDVVIILKTQDLEVIPNILEGFKTYPFKPEMLKDEKSFAKILDVIIQEPNVKLAVLPKQNIGYGAAYGYFYGFLRLVLPDFKKRLLEETLQNDPDLVPKTIKKMLIIMPESCFCPAELKSEKIEFTGKFIVRFAHRAGNQKRDYKSSLYKLIDVERDQDYYFVGELATPLLTMYETQTDGLCGMTKDQLYAERDAFYSTLKAILSHPENTGCNDQFKLLYWSDPATKKANQLDLYDFLLPVLRKEIMLERENERNPSKSGTTANVHPLLPNPRLLDTFITVDADGFNPARIYDEIGRYPMDRRPRGLCLIVNIANFDKGHRHLKARTGAERDGECLKKLFGDLHFEVQVHNDVNAQTLESLFLTMHIADHTNYNAFVCCILTHGKLGVIFTSDGKEVEILKLVDFFTDNNCSSLKGKPKMFFIQACQRGDNEMETGAAGNSMPHSSSTGDHSAQNTASDSSANVADRHTVEYTQEGISNIAVTEIEPILAADATCAPSVSTVDESLPRTFKHKSVLVPGSPDFLMSYSTLPGSISYRDTTTGSLYIQALNECLRKGEEIDRALKMVTTSVREKLRQREGYGQGQQRFQLPFHLTSGMDQLIYL